MTANGMLEAAEIGRLLYMDRFHAALAAGPLGLNAADAGHPARGEMADLADLADLRQLRDTAGAMPVAKVKMWRTADRYS